LGTRRLAAPLATLLTAGCAGMTGPQPNPEAERLAALEQRLSDAGETLDRQDQRIAELERRLERAKGDGDGGDGPDLEALRERVHRLEGSAEVNGHELERLSQQLEETFVEVERRLSRLERRLGRLEEEALSRSLSRPAADGAESGSAARSGGAADKGAEEASARRQRPPDHRRYQAAFDRMKNGDYAGAAQDFRQFLADFPDSDYADNAQYWLGEAYYVQKDYERALEVFQRVQREFPDSDKVPDALLKEGYAYYELQDYRMARKTLLEVTERFPDHRVAGLARNRLERIRKERI
jgi:tol-pal system protein YbgF